MPLEDAYTLTREPTCSLRAPCRQGEGPPYPSMGFGDVAIAASADEVLTTSALGIPDSGGKF
ncbi:hypothetical protein D3C86_520250 [compost metagenome]